MYKLSGKDFSYLTEWGDWLSVPYFCLDSISTCVLIC